MYSCDKVPPLPRLREGAGNSTGDGLSRALLYLRALSLPPEAESSVAARLREEGAGLAVAEALSFLENLLLREGLLPFQEKGPLMAVPPLNRSPMVSEEMDRLPWRTSLVRFVRLLGGELFGGGLFRG